MLIFGKLFYSNDAKNGQSTVVFEPTYRINYCPNGQSLKAPDKTTLPVVASVCRHAALNQVGGVTGCNNDLTAVAYYGSKKDSFHRIATIGEVVADRALTLSRCDMQRTHTAGSATSLYRATKRFFRRLLCHD